MGTITEEFYLKDLSFPSDLVVSPSGDFELVTGLANLKQALFHRLVTTQGSLIHRPNYGVGIKRFQNGLNSAANKSEIFNLIREQFAQDSRVDSVTGIQFKINEARPDLTQIIVSVKAKGYDESAMAFIPFGDVG